MSVPWTTALRTSIEAANTTSRAGRGDAASRFWRRRRRTFSTSMIASSTTSPSAMTRPARTMVLRVPPRAWRTSTAARSESGMARRLMTAVRHSKRKAARIAATSRQPQSMALLQVVEGHLDEGGRAEDRRVDLDAAQGGAQRLQGLLHAPRHVERVAPGLLLDDQQEAGAVVDDGVADRRGVALHHARHVADAQGRAAAEGDRHRGEVLRARDRSRLRDGEPLVGGVDEAPGAHGRGLPGGGDQRVEGQVVRAEALGVHEDLQLAVALAPDGDVGDAGDRHQAGTHRPPGEDREVHLGERLRGDADLHHPAQGREGREHHGRPGHGGEVAGHGGEPLLDELPRLEEGRALLEDQHDRRQPQHGLRAQRLQPGGAVERVLEGHGDQALDLGRGQAGRLGLHLDERRGELGEHVPGHVGDPADAHDREGRGQGHHEDALPERRADEPGHHLPFPSSVPSSSAAPWETTLAPGAGPPERTARSPVHAPDLDPAADEDVRRRRLVDPRPAVEVVDDGRPGHDAGLLRLAERAAPPRRARRGAAPRPRWARRRRGRSSRPRDRPSGGPSPRAPGVPASPGEPRASGRPRPATRRRPRGRRRTAGRAPTRRPGARCRRAASPPPPTARAPRAACS